MFMCLYVLKRTKEGNAFKACRLAHQTSTTMMPGDPYQTQLTQLGRPFLAESNKEPKLLNQIRNLGYTLATRVKNMPVDYPSGQALHPVIPVVDLAMEILRKYPEKLLFGYGHDTLDLACAKFERFWAMFQKLQPDHPVYRDRGSCLRRCIPVFCHADEGTSFRRTGILQVMWGPVLKSHFNSDHHAFLFTSLHTDVYKSANRVYELGNACLDSLMKAFAEEANAGYTNGVTLPLEQEPMYLVFVAQEGDLPAVAKLYHCYRSYAHAPNECCFWCEANDREKPYSDFRQTAAWRSTVNISLPWRNSAPTHAIVGANRTQFLAKDIFHVFHLGIARTCVASVLCYLALVGHFNAPGAGYISVPNRLLYAHSLFKEFCSSARETADIKTFSRDNLGWKSLNFMPESSMKGSDTRLVMKFLISRLDAPWNLDDVSELALDALQGLDSFMRVCYASDRTFLRSCEAQEAHKHLKMFLISYEKAARLCFNRGQLFFNLTPKYHIAMHVRDDLDSWKAAGFSMNPACFATQSAEDFIGKVSKLGTHGHPRLVALRTCERWLVRAWSKWCFVDP